MVGKVAVLGLGLIGGSLLRQLQAAGIEALGYAHRAETAQAAVAAVLNATTNLAEAVQAADLIVVAVPLKSMPQTFQALANLIDETADATIIDVGSVKTEVRAAAQAAGLSNRFVGAHPMAGNELSGFAASTADLLAGAQWALTTPACPARLHDVSEFIEDTLSGKVLIMDEKAHDEAQALISGLPHVLAVSLLNGVAASPLKDQALQLAAGSFRDGTRVAHTDPARTEAMITGNATAVAATLRHTIAELEDLATRLESGQPVTDFFTKADALRA